MAHGGHVFYESSFASSTAASSGSTVVITRAAMIYQTNLRGGEKRRVSRRITNQFQLLDRRMLLNISFTMGSQISLGGEHVNKVVWGIAANKQKLQRGFNNTNTYCTLTEELTKNPYCHCCHLNPHLVVTPSSKIWHGHHLSLLTVTQQSACDGWGIFNILILCNEHIVLLKT